MDWIKELNDCNRVPVFSVEDERFASFGKILHGYDFREMVAYMKEKTEIPSEESIYVASDPEMERFAVKDEIQAAFYGGMEIQVGYCNGRTTTYNGFEYHKGSEINVAVTGFMLGLGHSYDIKDGRYDTKMATAFFVPEGTAIELYQTTLHLAPMRVCDEGYKGIVILPKGTNTPLTETERKLRDEKKDCDKEAALLLQRNKWIIAHPSRAQLIAQGAFPGVTGENVELFYPSGKRGA